MKWLACFWAAVSLACAQSDGLLSNQDALKLEQRVVQLIESTGLAVPGLARAAAPSLEDARQVLVNLKTAPQNAGYTYNFVRDARAYLAIADTVPKPYPFPEEGRRQFTELRDSVERLDSHFRALLDAKEAQLHNPDPGNLQRYAEANEKLGPPAPQRPRIVFLGDSITDGWRLNEYYGSDRDFVNRGISGQTTGEMLGRMKADVIDLKPKAMLVLAGTNDLARGVSLPAIENNLAMIADLAEAHHIEVMFASLLPVSDYHKDVNPQYAQTSRRPPAKIQELNAWLKGYCERKRLRYVDYHSAMVDQSGALRADLSDDGLHPNAQGYRVMAPIALAAIGSEVPAAESRPVRTSKARKTAPPKVETPAAPAAASPPPTVTKTAPPAPATPTVTTTTQSGPAKPPVKAAAKPKAQPKPATPAPTPAATPAATKPAAETAKAAAKTTSTTTTKTTATTAPKKKKTGGIRAWLEKEHK